MSVIMLSEGSWVWGSLGCIHKVTLSDEKSRKSKDGEETPWNNTHSRHRWNWNPGCVEGHHTRVQEESQLEAGQFRLLRLMQWLWTRPRALCAAADWPASSGKGSVPDSHLSSNTYLCSKAYSLRQCKSREETLSVLNSQSKARAQISSLRPFCDRLSLSFVWVGFAGKAVERGCSPISKAEWLGLSSSKTGKHMETPQTGVCLGSPSFHDFQV